MSNDDHLRGKSALVTGANSGVGLETAYQLAQAGCSKVILACRTLEKGAAARQELLARGAPDVFDTLAIDVSDVRSATSAGKELLTRGHKLDLVILNAGTAGGSTVVRTSDGIDLTFAATLIGHHVLTLLLLNGGLLERSRIIISGSEASRGDVLGIKVPDLARIARTSFGGSVPDMLRAFTTASYPPAYNASSAYALAKLYAAWWAAELAPRLPPGSAVFAVSPGNAPTTKIGRDLPWPVRGIAFPLLGVVGPFIGMAHSVTTAGQRYLEAARFGDGQSGRFFASPAKKLTGPLVEQHTQWLQNSNMQAAAYRLIVELSGGIDREPSVTSAPRV